MLTRPVGVNRAPLRANRVGRTQSKRSTPRATPIQVLRRTDAHQVARFVDRQDLGNDLEHLRHDGFWLADAQPADRAPRNVRRGNCGRALAPQVGIHSALANAEKRRPLLAAGVCKRSDAAVEPAVRPVSGVSHRGEIRRQTNEMIERHDDVGSPAELQSHRCLRRRARGGCRRCGTGTSPRVRGRARCRPG